MDVIAVKLRAKERAILRALLSRSEHRDGSSSYEVINSAQYPTSKIGCKKKPEAVSTERERNLKSETSKGIHLKSYFDPLPVYSKFRTTL